MTSSHKLLNTALILCATEVAVLLGAILLELVFGQRFVLVTRINAISWLLCGGGSIVLSIVGFVRGQKRSAAILVFALSIALCL
jgi:heme/copper-type cytochrome/quinol oxidase subunit 1